MDEEQKPGAPATLCGWVGDFPPPPAWVLTYRPDLSEVPELSECGRGMSCSYTEGYFPPRIGWIRLTLSHPGTTLYGPIEILYALYTEAWEPVGVTGAIVAAPLPGERVEYSIPLVNDAARNSLLQRIRRVSG